MPEQLVLMQNFQSKISVYGTTLGLTPAQVTAGQDLCAAFIGAVNSTELAKTTMQAMTQWREEILNGEQTGKTPQAPVFPVVGATTYPVGVVKSFIKLRDQIVASPSYTQAIGEDLGIVGAETGKPVLEFIMPDLKAATSTGYWVNLSGSMQGMDALRVEYSRDGGTTFQTVAFLTNTPGGFQITPQNPALPEKGVIRAVYIKRNAEIGNYSANYPVTLS
ncbi:MAG: hypothetical protein AB7F88_12925 [Pyrinomonadaceae bacterium]